MRWFKHFSDSRNNPKILAIQKKLRVAGYARWFRLLEMVAERGGNGEAFAPRINLNEPHTDLGWVADELEIDRRTAKFTLKVFAEVGLIDPEAYRQNVLYVPQMREYVDEWTRKKQPSSSGATPEQVQSKSPQSQRSESKAESEPHPESESRSQSESGEHDLTSDRDHDRSTGPVFPDVPTYVTSDKYVDPHQSDRLPRWMRSDPWVALGIDYKRVPKEFRLDTSGGLTGSNFEFVLKKLWDAYRIECVKARESGSPGDFAAYVLDHVQEKNIKYPPVLLKRKKELCGS